MKFRKVLWKKTIMDDINIKFRLFGSMRCQDCLAVLKLFKEFNIPFEYIDTDDFSDEVQDFCDIHNVDMLPHVQILDLEENILFEHIGEMNFHHLMEYLEKFLK